ncbi:MAG: serine/threonine-protein kinase, partial [Cyanobacteria bacterium J06632_3]
MTNSPDNHTHQPPNISSGRTPDLLLNNRYKVLSTLGDGGFGQTFLAEDTHMPSNRKCVIKQLKPVHDRPDLHQLVQERFQREAVILEQLGEGHDQIPRLLANFQENGQFYLVQEWVQGHTLTQLVQGTGPQSEKEVQTILSHLLPVVSYVHRENIVHRDIKPDNIILRESDGKPVLIDFGAVKETMKTVLSSGQQSTRSIVVGTPGYMPSEQMSGRPVYASDIYGIGMTALYLLTGKAPHEIETDLQTGALKWREQVSGISPKFANFLDCATHVSLQSRFSSIAAMQNALNAMMISPVDPNVSTYISTEQAYTPQATQPAGTGNSNQDRNSTDRNRSPGITSAPPAVPNNIAAATASVPDISGQEENPTESRSRAAGTVGKSRDSENFSDRASQKRGVNWALVAPIVLVLSLTGIGAAGFFYKQAQDTPDDIERGPQELVLRADGDKETPTAQEISLPDTDDKSSRVDSPEENSATSSESQQSSNKTRAERIDDIADDIFAERHPELNGRKIQAGETALIAEWEKIRACEAVVDFIYYENNPELNGQRISTGDSRAQQEWNAIRSGVAGCRTQTNSSSGSASSSGSSSNSSSSGSSANTTGQSGKTRSEKIDDMADAIFYRRHPELNGRAIRANETSLSREWASIRACDAIVDFIYYERHPERVG